MKLHEYQLDVNAIKETVKRSRRGRPKKEEKALIETVYQITLQSLENNPEEIEQRLRLTSTFILMTNKMDKSRLPDLNMFKCYKGQSTAEIRFLLLKKEQMIDVVFVKTPERIEVLGIVYVMALLIFGMLEYRVRAEMKKQEKHSWNNYRISASSSSAKVGGRFAIFRIISATRRRESFAWQDMICPYTC